MKLTCLIFRPWLIPYTNGTLKTDRPALTARIDRHVTDCASCRAEAARLESNDAILHGYAARSRSREAQFDTASFSGNRSKTMTPLSSRVLASIQSDEKLHSSNRWSPNGLSFATAALGVVLFVSIINPQSGVFGMIHNFLVPHPKLISAPKPPYPVLPPPGTRDPMAPKNVNGGGVSVTPSVDGGDVNAQQTESTRGNDDGNIMSRLTTPSIVRQTSPAPAPMASSAGSSMNGNSVDHAGAYKASTADYNAATSEPSAQTTIDEHVVPVNNAPTIPAVNDAVETHPAGDAISNYITSPDPDSESLRPPPIGHADAYGATPPAAPAFKTLRQTQKATNQGLITNAPPTQSPASH